MKWLIVGGLVLTALAIYEIAVRLSRREPADAERVNRIRLLNMDGDSLWN